VDRLCSEFKTLNRNVLCVLNSIDNAPEVPLPSLPIKNELELQEFENILTINRSTRNQIGGQGNHYYDKR
jgi:hypothetical protein